MMTHELEILAPAKINLYMGVLGKRACGYHDIVSVMQKIDLCDRLHLSLEGSEFALHCPASNLPEDSSNLVWKAAFAFFGHTGIKNTVRITLHKTIPVAAGLGGGSSDAAAALCGLNRLFDAGLSEDALLALGGGLGSDVPFFVAHHQTALATGTGVDLKPISGPQGYWLVLVNPGIAVSTRWVYENLLLTSDDNPYKLSGYSHDPEFVRSRLEAVFRGESDCPPLFNDLERVTTAAHPVILTIKKQLVDDGALVALMSGSGPTVFGVFLQFEQAKRARDHVRKLYPEVFLVTPLS